MWDVYPVWLQISILAFGILAVTYDYLFTGYGKRSLCVALAGDL